MPHGAGMWRRLATALATQAACDRLTSGRVTFIRPIVRGMLVGRLLARACVRVGGVRFDRDSKGESSVKETRMRILGRLLTASLLIWLGGCSDSVPTSPTSLTQPTPGPFVVSGTLSEAVDGISRPLAGHQVRLLTISGTCGPVPMNCVQTERESVYFTDENGRYTAGVTAGSRVFAYGRLTTGPWQPCLASAVVNKDTTIDVQVVPVGSSLTPPAAASPMITGFVYETTAQGRQPLQGIGVSLEVGVSSFLVAVTQTNESGHFFLCRVNAPVLMGVGSHQEPIPGTDDSFFEIELRR